MFRLFVSILFVTLTVQVTFSQGKNIHGTKISTPPRIDGLLDDASWQNVPVASDFITNTPEFGKPATSKTEVKVIYDNTAIYIGAYIYDDPALVRKQFTPRDQEQRADVDYFSFFIDTYKDNQNAYQFLVTSRNVQSDARLAPNVESDFGVYGDLSWDAVWESQITFQNDGWIVEMKIPYSSIRFSSENAQDWGIQFLQFTRRLNETSFWNPVDPSISGFVNQFGILTALENLVPPLRLSFSPYISGGFRSTPYNVGGNKDEWLKSGGMDVKYGISESFTLDVTLIPDFGQVISDNVINNISPFEVQFRENRPFFTEGTELFNKAGIFYSRRIGRVPGMYEYVEDEVRNGSLQDYSIIKNPEVTRLYNAIKFSGRTRNNLGIGIFNALTQPAKAKLRRKLNGSDSTFVTEPLSNYNIIVLDQALKNRSYFTLTNTNVLRNGHERDANVTALDIALYDKQNRYGVFVRPRYSKIFGADSYDGFANEIRFGKVSGNLQFSVSNEFETAKYDPNDLGIISSPNEFTNEINVTYNIFKATKSFLNQRYGISVMHSYLFEPFAYQKTEVEAFSFWIFKNFWDIELRLGAFPGWYNDYFELRTPINNLETPRQKLKRAPYFYFFVEGSSDSRKRFFGRWNFGAAEGALPDNLFYRIELGARYRFSDRFSLDANFDRQHDHGQFGYAERDNLTGAPILARRKYTDVTMVMSGIYNFTSRMNITFRMRHFWNKLENTNLYNVKSDGYWTERIDINPSDYNVNYNAFNLDVFCTWDFRLGSRIILGWKNWLGRDFEDGINGFNHTSYFANGKEMFSSPHGNEITARFIYYLDYLQFRKRK